MSKTKGFLLAVAVAAMAFTLSCSSVNDDDGGSSSSGNGGGGSSSSVGSNNNSSPSGGDHFNPNIQYGSFTDSRDNKTYRSVVIDGKTWMAENLNYDVPNNATDVCYDNNPDNCAKYGRLYDWATAMEACPAGWSLPKKADWEELIRAVGGSVTIDGGSNPAGTKLRANVSGWTSGAIDAGPGTDDYGFSALPGGKGGTSGSFSRVGSQGNWWTATNGLNNNIAYDYYMPGSLTGVGGLGINQENKSSNLFSVRCLQDNSSGGGGSSSSVGGSNIIEFTDDRDNKTYKAVSINNGQTWWMAENLNYDIPDYTDDVCYNNNSSNCTKYGRLYDWVAAIVFACPDGWRLPTNNDWDELLRWVDEQNGGEGSGDIYDSYTAGRHLKASSGWNSSGNGTDKYGFSALPGGVGGSDGFEAVGNIGYWWTGSGFEVDENIDLLPYYRFMSFDQNSALWLLGNVSNLMSVRCVVDAEG